MEKEKITKQEKSESDVLLQNKETSQIDTKDDSVVDTSLVDKNETESKKNNTKKKAEKNQLHGRRRLFADYQYKEYTNKKGKTKRKKVYTGQYYGYVIPKQERKNEAAYLGKIKLIYSVIWVLMVAMWVLASSVTNAMGLGYKGDTGFQGQHFYVLLPYLCGALPLMLSIMTIIEFIFTKGNKHERAFAESLKQNLKGQTITALVCGVLTILSETLFVFLNFKQIISINNEIILVIFMAAYSAISVIWLRFQASFPMEEKR